MQIYLIITALIILACVLLNKAANRIGIPVLLAFILLGMVFGVDGIFGISYDDYSGAEQICSIALIFIMFYGGFGTNWKYAKPVAGKAVALSTLGVVFTALLTGVFCHFILKLPWITALLLGSVVGSTDAASVFSILRSKGLNLKYNTASLLEMESGSNDPAAYMMTLIMIAAAEGNVKGQDMALLLVSQIGLGIVFGVFMATAAGWILKRFEFEDAGFAMAFVVGIALLSYALPAALNGNGYLSAYIAGIILGNTAFPGKKNLVHFFDGITSLMQLALFFLLGLLATPHDMTGVAGTAVAAAVFLILVARPVAVFLILTPFRCPVNQMLLVSFSGLRGAASIVFAIMAMTNSGTAGELIFHVVVIVVLFSILIQGTLLPKMSRALDMVDDTEDVRKSFTDYTDEMTVGFIEVAIPKGHAWNGQKLSDLVLPPQTLVVLVDRKNQMIVPNGDTVIETGDRLVLTAGMPEEIHGIQLSERVLGKEDESVGKTVEQYPMEDGVLMIMIQRNGEIIIPSGATVLQEEDLLVFNRVKERKF